MLLNIKRVFSLFGLVGALFTHGLAQASAVIIPTPPQLSASAYLLLDADTGKVLVEGNPNQPLAPASLTKMMTSYIVSEEISAGRLSDLDKVLISDDAWRRGGAASGSSTMFLKPRTEVSVIDLLRGVIIQSGNDASIALAQHIAGSENAFADIMNQQAKLLGMADSHFRNATGWPAEGHATTAKDLATLAGALINDHPKHYALYAEKYFKYNGINQPNRNKLLFTNKLVDGLKTGHTNEAGYCLVASAKQNDMRLISVVLGTKSEKIRAQESQQLLAYGFRYYKTHTLYSAEDTVSTAKVWAGTQEQIALGVKAPLVATIPKGSYDSLEAKTHIDNVIKAPLKAGQVLGTLKVSLNGEFIAEAELVAKNDVTEAGFFARTMDAILLMFESDGSDSSNTAAE